MSTLLWISIVVTPVVCHIFLVPPELAAMAARKRRVVNFWAWGKGVGEKYECFAFPLF